jgi:hypothetical protein
MPAPSVLLLLLRQRRVLHARANPWRGLRRAAGREGRG